MTDKTRKYTTYAALALSLFGFYPFLSPACTPIMVTDPATGQPREATAEEARWVLAQPAEMVRDIGDATGHPEWYPIADIAVRIAAFVYALRFGQVKPPQTPAAPTGGI